MDIARLVEFTTNHPVMILAFVGVLIALVFSEVRSRLNGMKSVGPLQATQLSNRENAIFLDIRDDTEYHTGHIPDAIHIPLKQLPERVRELEKHKSCPVITYCRSGNRSTATGGILKKHGFESVYNLGGGLAAWQKANLPVSTK